MLSALLTRALDTTHGVFGKSIEGVEGIESSGQEYRELSPRLSRASIAISTLLP